MVAALNAIYDVYADENAAYDASVFRAGGYLNVLRQSSAKVRSMVSPICSFILLIPRLSFVPYMRD